MGELDPYTHGMDLSAHVSTRPEPDRKLACAFEGRCEHKPGSLPLLMVGRSEALALGMADPGPEGSMWLCAPLYGALRLSAAEGDLAEVLSLKGITARGVRHAHVVEAVAEEVLLA